MNPDYQRGFIQLFYFTWLHNSEAIAYFFGIVLCLGLLFVKVRRRALLFLLGFVFLLIRFWYNKHIVGPLYEQTGSVLIREETMVTGKRMLDLFFNDLVPFGLYIAGWGCLFVGIVVSVGVKPQQFLKMLKRK